MSVVSGCERHQTLLWKMCPVRPLALLWCGSSRDSTALSAGLYSWFLHMTGCLYILSPDSTQSIQQLIDWTEGAPGRTAVRFVAFCDKNHHKVLILLSFFSGAVSDMKVLVVLVLAVFTGERLLIHYLWSRSILDIQTTVNKKCFCLISRSWLQCQRHMARPAQTEGWNGERCFLGLRCKGNRDRRGVPEEDQRVRAGTGNEVRVLQC